MSDNEISRRGLALGGLALMLSGCTQATGAMSLAFPERPLPDPRFLRQRVQYDGGESPGTIVVDIADRFLYAVEENGWATRYGVAVGEEGLTFTGRATVGRKADLAIVATHYQHDEAQAALAAICRRGSRRTEQPAWRACALSLPGRARHEVPDTRYKRAVADWDSSVERVHPFDK